MARSFVKALLEWGPYNHLQNRVYVYDLIMYFLVTKCILRITGVKFEFSFFVFRESYLLDHYRIHEFIQKIAGVRKLSFVDVGCNHGFVLLYALYWMKRSKVRIPEIDYVGIDPSPLNFLFFRWASSVSKINYRLIRRAVVYDDAKHAVFKYGKRVSGNYNIEGSNKFFYEAPSDNVIYLTVETMTFQEVLDIISDQKGSDALIVKYDFKNRNAAAFMETREIMDAFGKPFLLAAEVDKTYPGDVSKSEYLGDTGKTLIYSNLV